MRILFDIGHPAHVHLLRNTYFQLIENNHFVLVTVKNISSAKSLLDLYNIKYLDIGSKSDSIIKKGLNQFKYNLRLFKLVKKYKIELGIGTSITIAHVSRLTKMKSIILDDDDDDVEPLFVKYAHPFADVILSPDVLIGKRKSKNTVFYSGYHELAYLHPNNFTPDKTVLEEVGLKNEDKYFIVRFNSFKAHHDVGVKGLSLNQQTILIDLLRAHGKVFITTEREIDSVFKKYQLNISPEKTHSLMCHATLFLGDSQTMTSEASMLGVPSIRCNSLVGKLSYLEEIENRYGLTFGFSPDHFNLMINKVSELLEDNNLKENWLIKRNNMLKDKIDVTEFFLSFVENYAKRNGFSEAKKDI